MEIKFNICDKVVYFNTAEGRVATAEVKAIRVIPTAVSKDADGNNVLESKVVLYETVEGPILTETECFESADACREFYKAFFK